MVLWLFFAGSLFCAWSLLQALAAYRDGRLAEIHAEIAEEWEREEEERRHREYGGR
jgi:hypothetical protein